MLLSINQDLFSCIEERNSYSHYLCGNSAMRNKNDTKRRQFAFLGASTALAAIVIMSILSLASLLSLSSAQAQAQAGIVNERQVIEIADPDDQEPIALTGILIGCLRLGPPNGDFFDVIDCVIAASQTREP
jgi:hypothetical protein